MSVSQVNTINEHFKLPIYYNDKKQSIAPNITKDLELIETVDSSGIPIYNYYFNTNNELSKQVAKQAAEYYTVDKQFLTENQQLLKTYSKSSSLYSDYTNIIGVWNEIKTDTGFKDKYYYVTWPSWKFLNKSEHFLQVMSIYNIASPIISLLIPIIILIIPFFIIRFKGLQLTISEYIDVLKIIMSNHAIGKLFTHFNTVSAQQKIYLLLSAGFYVFSVYQNELVCMRYNANMKRIHENLETIRDYINHTVTAMKHYTSFAGEFKTHNKFNETLSEKIQILTKFNESIATITKYEFTNYKKITEIGRVMKLFYEIHDDEQFNTAFLYSLGFNGYLDCIDGLTTNIANQQINFADFVKSKSVFKRSYYACLKDSEPVKNTVKLYKSGIITGPNASGKTTILKSTLINVLVTQQFGCGFYESAQLKPFKYIHCYLNIPDTSGRDSLFQAEARRCKEILDLISKNKRDGHFCVFDELYSGTNPEEAVTSATAFMEYMVKNPNVQCMLTTHFVEICNQLKKNPAIDNYNMFTTKTDTKMNYTYKLKSGISTVKGGVNILYDMNYPDEIIKRATAITR